MNTIYAFWKLIRPHQWIKNLFLFVPIFFAGDVFNTNKILLLFLGFLSFSIGSSAVYILNDFKDIESDKLHPLKKERPLASGQIKKSFATLMMILLGILGLSLAYLIGKSFFFLLLAYLIINVFYSFGLKNVSIVDILIVAIGFVLRTIGGGLIANVYISHWLIIMIFLLSLFLVVAKRREDMLEFVLSGKAIRKAIANYNMDFINLTLTMLSGVIIVAYIMYTVSPDVTNRLHSENLYMTSIFVIIGILRYMQITLVENKSGSPVRILYTDTFIHITMAGWILSFFLIIYLK
jgi:decaprenyl-phosphate phosphoribosyltransferase